MNFAFPGSLNRQNGAALLVLVFFVVLAATSVLLSRLNTATKGPVQNNAQNARVLLEAKAALLGYAISNPGEFGFLPCPDKGTAANEGQGALTCDGANENSIGRFPWRSLELAALKDGDDECLWYAVSGSYKSGTTKPNMLNDDSLGMFRIVREDGTTPLIGATPDSRPVAVIFAPGLALDGQTRTPAGGGVDQCGGNYVADDYLDSLAGVDNADLSTNDYIVDDFISSATVRDATSGEVLFNDQFVYITHGEIWDALTTSAKTSAGFTSKMTELTVRVARCLVEYARYPQSTAPVCGFDPNTANCTLPWPAPLVLPAGVNNDYRVDNAYDDMASTDNLLSGRVPDVVDDSQTDISDADRPSNLITTCSEFTSSPEYLALWQNWKDHLFYAVADNFRAMPRSGVQALGLCGSGERCITLNSSWPGDDYAAIIWFAGTATTGQSHELDPVAPPHGTTDDRQLVTNYMEGANNQADYVNTAGDDNKRYDTGVVGTNDIMTCMDDNDTTSSLFVISTCP